jgi:hypothetical protein
MAWPRSASRWNLFRLHYPAGERTRSQNSEVRILLYGERDYR